MWVALKFLSKETDILTKRLRRDLQGKEKRQKQLSKTIDHFEIGHRKVVEKAIIK